MTDPPRADPSTSWARDSRASEPRMRIADDLESADARTFVYVDDRGRVRPVWRYRVRQIGSWSVLLLLALGSAAIIAPLAGMWAAIAALFMIALIVHLALLAHWIHRGVVLLAHDRLELADRVLARAARFSLHQIGIRALANQNRSALAQRRGDHERALELNRRALRLRELLPSPFGKGLHYYLLRYAEATLLCNLGRSSEARRRLTAIAEPPTGEYLRLRRWTAELYLALVEDDPKLDRGMLAERSERAEQLRTNPELLALCAWAWAKLGERERALAHLASARRYEGSQPFARSLPHLARWIDASLPDVDPAEPTDSSRQSR